MRVGLTGGIASGKSAVAEFLKNENIPVVDADEVSRAVMRPGSSLFHDIVQAFGHEVLNQDGDLDRMALGEKVFSNPQALERLNALTHPVIWAEMQRQVTELEKVHPLVVVMVPLLLENRRQDWVDEVWLVSLPRQVQKARLMERNHLTEEQAEARISAQMPLAEKLTLADRVIDNSGSLEQLHQSLLEVLRQAQHSL
ncbi:MAG: dephospho-CoA kinase [Candidatus Eremiobacteraeota bacterium]|nr:dephospho-CoA kinase [Candidatus Eremiobacteraeota bacterium]MCW5866457.1 dephospho-CoA kinase [Candidatus Eremiobacteraeota bacterium]